MRRPATPASGAALLLTLAFLVCSCPRKEEPVPEPAPPAERQAPEDVAQQQAGTAEPPVAPAAPRPDDAAAEDSGTAVPEAPAEVPPLGGISWSTVPALLDVMRDTVVRLDVSWTGVPDEDYECRFDPGDRSGLRTGCHLEHRFAGGLADRVVSLSVLFQGREVFSENRSLPLERLPVRELPAETSMLPPRPVEEGAVRMLFLPLYALPTEQDGATLRAAADIAAADLVAVLFNTEVSAEAAQVLLQAVGSGGRRVVPVYCGGGSGGLPAGDALDLLMHGSGADLPYRAGLLVGSTLLVLLDSRRSGVVLDEEKWLVDQLALGKVAAHRIVVSCRPFEPWTARQAPELAPRYRYYEKLLRGDVSLLVSSSHPAFFSGAYGQVPVLSPGCATGAPEPLLSTPAAQPRAASIVDLVPGQPPRVLAISLEHPGDSLEIVVPSKVGNYERRK